MYVTAASVLLTAAERLASSGSSLLRVRCRFLEDVSEKRKRSSYHLIQISIN